MNEVEMMYAELDMEAAAEYARVANEGDGDTSWDTTFWHAEDVEGMAIPF